MNREPKGRGGAAQQPVLWLGMAGFAAAQRAFLEASLVRSGDWPRWRVVPFADADAWWVNGASVRLTPEGRLHVAHEAPGEPPLQLDLADVDRPVAFARPIAGDDFEPRLAFDPALEANIQSVLLRFENWLWLTRAQFALGAQIIERGADLRHGVFQVSHAGKLLAVLDFRQGKGAVLPRVDSADLWQARWDRRPPGARALPASFTPVMPSQMAWSYVRRTEREDLLPQRYRSQTIHYRQAPGVPVRWLRDSQLLVLRELSSQSCTLKDLRGRTGLPSADLEHDLTCLYYAGAITTTRSKAAGRRPGPQPASNLTAPASLEHRQLPAPDSV